MRIIAHHRIHVGLADMAFASCRAYGGIGFSIEEPRTVIEFEPWHCLELDGFSHLDARTQRHLHRVCTATIPPGGGFRALLKTMPRQHSGFGSTTTLALALLVGINSLFDLGLSRATMQLRSGRGGASGIGIHTFFEGGVVWDGGHALADDQELLPSGSRTPSALPPMLARIEFPQHWRIALVLPDDAQVAGDLECELFRTNTPGPKIDSLRAMAALYHGVLPAIKLADIQILGCALRELHEVGFKSCEISLRRPTTRHLLARLQRLPQVAAGMSSFGPLIYAICLGDDQRSINEILTACRDSGARWLGAARGWNGGYEIVKDGP